MAMHAPRIDGQLAACRRVSGRRQGDDISPPPLAPASQSGRVVERFRHSSWVIGALERAISRVECPRSPAVTTVANAPARQAGKLQGSDRARYGYSRVGAYHLYWPLTSLPLHPPPSTLHQQAGQAGKQAAAAARVPKASSIIITTITSTMPVTSPCCPKPRYYSIITSSGDEMACNKNGSIADFLLSRPLTHMHLCSSRMQPLSPFTAHRFATGRLPSRPPGSYPTCHLQPSCPGCFLHSIACTEKRYEFLLHRCYDSQPQVELSE